MSKIVQMFSTAVGRSWRNQLFSSQQIGAKKEGCYEEAQTCTTYGNENEADLF